MTKTMPKPKGTCGATKLKIMAVIYNNEQQGLKSYGYHIWQCLREFFYTYMNEGDIRNVYHHLEDLCRLGYIAKCPNTSDHIKQCYRMTEQGLSLEEKYRNYLMVLNQRGSRLLS